jgi:hypothetical protein
MNGMLMNHCLQFLSGYWKCGAGYEVTLSVSYGCKKLRYIFLSMSAACWLACVYMVWCFRGKYELIIGFSLWICYIGMFPRTVPSKRDPGFALTSIMHQVLDVWLVTVGVSDRSLSDIEIFPNCWDYVWIHYLASEGPVTSTSLAKVIMHNQTI